MLSQSMETIIDVLVARHNAVRESLNSKGDISLMLDIDHEFRKVLVLSIGSFFESQITDSMSNLANNTQSERIATLIKAKAISRQYHTYFDWGGNNPNSFLKLFGTAFKESVQKEMKKNSQLTNGCSGFLKLGDKRNVLVHENFGNAQMDWTLEEIMQMYRSALVFITYLSGRVQEKEIY